MQKKQATCILPHGAAVLEVSRQTAKQYLDLNSDK